MTKNRNYYFPSPWMRASDLPPEGKNFTVTGVDDEIVGKDETLKPALTFEETDKKLLLNATQFDAMMQLTGDEDADHWTGVRVRLIPVTVTIENRKAGTREDVQTIRIRPASPLVATTGKEENGNSEDDEPLPF